MFNPTAIPRSAFVMLTAALCARIGDHPPDEAKRARAMGEALADEFGLKDDPNAPRDLEDAESQLAELRSQLAHADEQIEAKENTIAEQLVTITQLRRELSSVAPPTTGRGPDDVPPGEDTKSETPDAKGKAAKTK